VLYFTADWHLDNASIQRYCGRPFGNVDAMNAALLANCLATVGPDDTLYMLGDFACNPDAYEAYAAMLQCSFNTVFIKGNHDPKKCDAESTLSLRWNKRRYYLSHAPWRQWRAGTVMLHGHVHGNPVSIPSGTLAHLRFDVGVDTKWGGRKYYPVSVEQIEKRIRQLDRTAAR